LASGELRLAGGTGVVLGAGDLVVVREAPPAVAARYEVVVESGLMLALDFVQDEETRSLGCAREAVNRVQKLRKAAGLLVSDVVDVFYEVRAASSAAAVAAAVADEDEDAGGGLAMAAAPAAAVAVAAGASAAAAASASPPPPPQQQPAASAEALQQQAQWVASALVASRALVRTTLQRPFLPEAARAAGAPVLAQGEDVVAGALLRLVITRAGAEPPVAPLLAAGVDGDARRAALALAMGGALAERLLDALRAE